MKKIFLLAIICLICLATGAEADTVTITVDPVNEIALGGGVVSLAINSATAGQEPNPATSSTATFSFSTNQDSNKITGQLNSAMPASTTLSVELTAIGGSWTGTGPQTLSIAPVTLAQGNRGRAQGKAIAYTFSATTSAGAIPAGTRSVTFTLTGP